MCYSLYKQAHHRRIYNSLELVSVKGRDLMTIDIVHYRGNQKRYLITSFSVYFITALFKFLF